MNSSISEPRADWPELIEEWGRSGLTQKVFCEQKGVSYAAFCSQRSRRNRRRVKTKKARPKNVEAKQTAAFIPVEVESLEPQPMASVEKALPKGSAQSEIEVELPFGVTLRFRGVSAQ